MRPAVDASVLLVALGGAASKLVTRPNFEFLTTSFTFDEVLEYMPVLAASKGLRLDRLEKNVHAVPLEIIPSDVFAGKREAAHNRIAWRDPDDVDLLALALHFDLTIWTNDKDLENCGVPTLTTAELLAIVMPTER